MKVVKKLSASIHYSVHNGIKRVTLSAIHTVPYGIFIRKHKNERYVGGLQENKVYFFFSEKSYILKDWKK